MLRTLWKHLMRKCLDKHGWMRALCAVLSLALLGAPLSAVASNPNNLQSLSVAIVASDDLTLSPLTARERDPQSLLALCYEGLVALDDDDRPIPCLATSWDAPADGSDRWTFHLRTDATFHNGKPLTAQDVCATLDYIYALGGYDEDRKSSLPAEERGVYSNVVEAYVRSWKALDDYTVQITGIRRYYGILLAMTFPILPAEEVSNPLPPGTGPYRIAQYDPGDRLWLTAWQGWWKSVPNIRNIMAYIYPNVERALDAFDSGQASVTMTRSLSATRYSGSLRSFSMSYRTRQVEMLLMHHNERRGILRDEYVRRAIIAAIDRSTLAKQVYQGMATPVNIPIAPGTWLYDESATQETYDPALARSILEQDGWTLNGEGIREKNIEGTPTLLKLALLTYEEPSGSVRRTAAASIAEMLGQVGIICTVESPATFERVRERLTAGNFDLALCGMNLDVVPDPGFMFMALTTNYCRYRNDTMIDLIKKLRSEASEEGYQRAMSEVQHQFVSDAPFMCLYFRNGALLTRDTFSNVRTLRELELLRGVESW